MAKSVIMDSNQTPETYRISTNGFCANISILFLISLVISIIPLLLNKDSSIFYSSQPFYIAVLLLFVGVMYYKWYGVLLAAFTFTICGLFYRFEPGVIFLNSILNIGQIVLLLLSYLGLKKIRTQNLNMYSKGDFFVSVYNFLLILIFIGYIVACTSAEKGSLQVLGMFFGAVMIITLIKAAVARDVRLLYFTFMIALLPSVVISSIAAFLNGIPAGERLEYIAVWSFSNYVLLQTAGYLMYQIFFTREIRMIENSKIIKVDAGSIAFYISILLWNLLIIGMMNDNIIKINSPIYFFPWALGNIFLIMNLYFSSFYDAEAENDKFSWYEKRVVIVEKNTATIITLISFMLPLTFSLIESIPSYLPIFFIANIFCACLSIGLIWTPKKNVKFIALLKALKTIFYTYSITLLMLCVIMVMSLI